MGHMSSKRQSEEKFVVVDEEEKVLAEEQPEERRKEQPGWENIDDDDELSLRRLPVLEFGETLFSPDAGAVHDGGDVVVHRIARRELGGDPKPLQEEVMMLSKAAECDGMSIMLPVLRMAISDEAVYIFSPPCDMIFLDLLNSNTHKRCLAFAEKDARDIVREMLQCLIDLQEHHGFFAPLRLANFVRDATGAVRFRPSFRSLALIVRMQCAVGTPILTAPEILSATACDARCHVWSMGVIAYLMLVGFSPFYGETVPQVFEQIMEADFEFPEPYFDEISEHARAFIEECVVVDLEDRLSPQQALHHPWLSTKCREIILLLLWSHGQPDMLLNVLPKDIVREVICKQHVWPTRHDKCWVR